MSDHLERHGIEGLWGMLENPAEASHAELPASDSSNPYEALLMHETVRRLMPDDGFKYMHGPAAAGTQFFKAMEPARLAELIDMCDRFIR